MEPYIEPPYTGRQRQIIGVCSFCLVISTAAVALRLTARRQFGIKLWWDDYITVVALVDQCLSNDGIMADWCSDSLI